MDLKSKKKVCIKKLFEKSKFENPKSKYLRHEPVLTAIKLYIARL